MRVPSAKSNPEVLDSYREAFSSIPGVVSIRTRPETGSIVIHYDPKHEQEFQHNFDSSVSRYLSMAPSVLPGDEVTELTKRIEMEADFLAAHSSVAKAIVEIFRGVDRELKIITGNTIDLKIVVAGGLAAYTFLYLGLEAGTPMWVTLAIFTVNHFVELRGGATAAAAPSAVRG